MIDDLYSLLARMVNWKNIALLAFLLIPFTLILFPISQRQFTQWSGDPQPILDLAFQYTPERVYQLFDALGPAGRRLYLYNELTVDLAFPFVYGLLACLGLIFLLRKAFPPDSSTQKLALLPLAMTLADYGENIALAVVLLHYPERWTSTAQLANLLTLLKWGLGAVGVILALVALGRILWKRIHPNAGHAAHP